MNYIKSRNILLIDSAFQPIMFIGRKSALKKIFKEKAIFLMNEEVLQLLNNVINVSKIYSAGKNGTRFYIFLRDDYKCQYCGKDVRKKGRTLDHILPKSKGGLTSYKNCVTACRKCNLQKGSKTLADAGMSLLNVPYTPSYLTLLKKLDKNNIWERFCEWIK